MSKFCKKRIQTWCHWRPVETPTIPWPTAIRVEEDVHGVGHARYDWRQEVTGRSWTTVGVAAPLAQQGCPVPICDLDIVVGTTICKPNSSEGELYPQNFPTLHMNCLCLIEVVGIFFRVVWRSDNTCLKQSFKLNLTKDRFLIIFSAPLTLAATAVCRTSWGDLPESGSGGRVGDTSKVEPRWALAAAAAFVTSCKLVFAVTGFKVCAGAARGG